MLHAICIDTGPCTRSQELAGFIPRALAPAALDDGRRRSPKVADVPADF
jgi:hypothetical protein